MKYAHIVEAVFDRPWAITDRAMDTIVAILNERLAGVRLSEDQIAERLAAARPTPAAAAGTSSTQRTVAVIPVEGVIVPKADLFTEISGGTSVENLTKQFRQALADPGVDAIVFAIDSPGGMMDGVPEFAAEIRAARGQKPISAVAQYMAASAAYWIASQCDDISVSPSAMVGSIGTVMRHQDLSGAYAQKGISTTLVSAGRYKTAANEYGPLSEEAKAYLQGLVDDANALFTKDVARGRNVPVADARGERFGEGQMFSAEASVSRGMADRVATLEQTITAAAKRSQRAGRSAEADEAMRYMVVSSGVEDGEADGVIAAAGDAALVDQALRAEAPDAEARAAAALLAGPIPRHKTATDDRPWDGPAEEAKIPDDVTGAALDAFYAEKDTSAENPDTKAAHSFIHHRGGRTAGAASTVASSAGIGILNGGRGGTKAPAADRPGIHAHLAGHLRDAGQEPPPLRNEADEAELVALAARIHRRGD